jgi:hypothetical protein
MQRDLLGNAKYLNNSIVSIKRRCETNSVCSINIEMQITGVNIFLNG